MDLEDTIHPPRQLHVVGRDQRRHTLATDEVDELSENILRGVWVEVAGRFIIHQKLPRIRESTSDRGALLLTAR